MPVEKHASGGPGPSCSYKPNVTGDIIRASPAALTALECLILQRLARTRKEVPESMDVAVLHGGYLLCTGFPPLRKANT